MFKFVHWQTLGFYLLPPLLALCVWMEVEFKTDLSAFIIAGDNAEDILLASEMQTGTLSRRYIISIGSVDSTTVDKAFAQSLAQAFNKMDGVEEAWLIGGAGQQGQLSNTMQQLYGAYANGMYSLNPAQSLEVLLTEQGLQQRAALLKQLLLSPQGGLFKQVALQDPLLLTLQGFKTVAGQMQQVLVKDSAYQNIILQTTMAGLDALEQTRIQEAIKQVFHSINKQDLYQLEMTGVPIFAVATQALIQGDITQVSVLSSLALVLLFLVIFRSLSISFHVFTLLGIVILSSILSTYFVFGYVHGMTLAIGSTLIGICIDYPIHAVSHAQSVSKDQRISVVSKIWPSMILGGITTMIGYLALGASGYPGFQQVAVYAATGILVSLLLTRYIFPYLLRNEQPKRLQVPWVSAWANFCLKYRRWLMLLLLIGVALSMLSLRSLHWMTDMQALTPELDYLKQNDKRIRARMTSIEPGRFVLISGKTVEAALQKAEVVYSLLGQLKQQGKLMDYYGFYPWILSAQKQQQNQQWLQLNLTEQKQNLWQQALTQQGLSVTRLGTLNYASTEILSLDNVLNSPAKKMIDSRIVQGEKQTIMMIWLAEHQPEALRLALDNLDGAQYFSQRDLLNNMTKNYTERAKNLLMIGLGLIIMLLIIRYKSLFKAIQTLLPAVLSAFLILSFWSLSGEAISFLHLVGFLLVVAICVDYGIFYQENRGGDIQLTYQAMSASMLTSALAFGSLMSAESTSLRILASVVTVGVLLGFLLCPLIIGNRDFSRS